MAGPDGSISVSHGDIEAQAKNLADLKNEVELALNSCKQQIESLRDSGAFKTQNAGESFQTTFTEWHTSAQKTVALLADFGTHLSKTSAAFAEVDAAYTLK